MSDYTISDSDFVIRVIIGQHSSALDKADYYSEQEQSEIDEEALFEVEDDFSPKWLIEIILTLIIINNYKSINIRIN